MGIRLVSVLKMFSMIAVIILTLVALLYVLGAFGDETARRSAVKLMEIIGILAGASFVIVVLMSVGRPHIPTLREQQKEKESRQESATKQ